MEIPRIKQKDFEIYPQNNKDGWTIEIDYEGYVYAEISIPYEKIKTIVDYITQQEVKKELTSSNSGYAEAFQEAFNLLKKNYRNGMLTHLAMIDWARKWEKLGCTKNAILEK